jgi:hypothetical protein
LGNGANELVLVSGQCDVDSIMSLPLDRLIDAHDDHSGVGVGSRVDSS